MVFPLSLIWSQFDAAPNGKGRTGSRNKSRAASRLATEQERPSRTVSEAGKSKPTTGEFGAALATNKQRAHQHKMCGTATSEPDCKAEEQGEAKPTHSGETVTSQERIEGAIKRYVIAVLEAKPQVES